MPPSDPAAVPPPEWAVEMAGAYFDLLRAMPGRPQYREHLAAFLAAFRESTLREAADRLTAMIEDDERDSCGERLLDTDSDRRIVAYASNAILSLLHTPPSGGGA